MSDKAEVSHMCKVTERQKELYFGESLPCDWHSAMPAHKYFIYSYSTAQYAALASFFKNEKTEVQSSKVTSPRFLSCRKLPPCSGSL